MFAALVAAVAHAQTPTTVGTFDGDSYDDRFGWAASGAGDVNNDGVPDFIGGSRNDDNNGSNSGSARVISGATGLPLYTFYGDSAGDLFGVSVSGAGDVNGDGFADLIVGAFFDDNNGTNSGSARVFSGADGSILYTFNGDAAGDQFGVSVSGAGDVNDDGFADVIVGARTDDNNGTNSGSARVFSGADGSILYTFSGDSAGAYFGSSVSGAGDVNADGYADLIVGAFLDSTIGYRFGSAKVFSGLDGTILHSFSGDSTEDLFGSSVSGAGDVNCDGYADLIVGAYQDDFNPNDFVGSAQVFSGRDGMLLYKFYGEVAGDTLGGAVSGAGDVNGDGYADVIAGASANDHNGWGSGSARVYSGKTGSLLQTLYGANYNDRFGSAVSSAGDVDGDGTAEILVGAYLDDNHGTDSGSVLVISLGFTPSNPMTMLEDLMQDVVELNLQRGIENSLDAKLDAALSALEEARRNGEQVAVNVLHAFVSAVEAQSGNKITVSDATDLATSACAIINVIEAQ